MDNPKYIRSGEWRDSGAAVSRFWSIIMVFGADSGQAI